MIMLEKQEKPGMKENKEAFVNGVCEICGEEACEVPSRFLHYGYILFHRYVCDNCGYSWVEP